MAEYFRKFKLMFKSPGISAVVRWSKCVHLRIVLVCILTVASTICSLYFTLTTKGLVDGAVSSDMSALRHYGILLGVLIAVRFILSAVQARLRISASAGLQKSMQRMLVEKILSREYAGLKGFHSGELVNRVFSDMSVVKGGVMNILPNFINILVSFFGAAAILIMMDWHFVILMALGGFMSLGLMLLFRRPMKQRHRRMQEAEGALHAETQEMLENIRLIKASVSEERATNRIGGYQETLEKEQIRQGMFSFHMNNGMGMVFQISWLFCMLWGCLNIYHGNLTYGSLAAMLQLIGRIEGPIANAVSLAGQAYGVISSSERLLELTELPEEEQGEILSTFDSILLDDITFRYNDGVEDVLKNVSCEIKKGDFMALTGISGGGKTSLFQLLLGIYRPTSGRLVFIADGREVPATKGTRRLFAYVPQGNTLFSGTLRENLKMFTDSATDEELMRAAKAACIDHVVEEIGLDAVLGERGVGLSEGQAQRVAVARALVSEAPILLLDEATSALDEETEAKLLKNISAMREKTCIIVTHRHAALEICDYTMHLSEGRMTKAAERGH